jgi:hypothetical protein
MSEIIGHLLAAGQRAEVFEWGSRVVKLYRSTAAKRVIFGEAAIHAAVEALGFPFPRSGAYSRSATAGASCSTA